MLTVGHNFEPHNLATCFGRWVNPYVCFVFSDLAGTTVNCICRMFSDRSKSCSWGERCIDGRCVGMRCRKQFALWIFGSNGLHLHSTKIYQHVPFPTFGYAQVIIRTTKIYQNLRNPPLEQGISVLLICYEHVWYKYRSLFKYSKQPCCFQLHVWIAGNMFASTCSKCGCWQLLQGQWSEQCKIHGPNPEFHKTVNDAYFE